MVLPGRTLCFNLVLRLMLSDPEPYFSFALHAEILLTIEAALLFAIEFSILKLCLHSQNHSRHCLNEFYHLATLDLLFTL